MPRERAAVAGALVRIAAAAIALAPITGAAWWISRRRARALATPAGARAALRQLGVDARGPIAARPLGGGRSNAVVEVAVGGRALIVKRALPMGSVLAFAARLVGPQPFARAVGGGARIARERAALIALRAAGVAVPAVIAAAPAHGLLALERVDGVPLPARASAPDFAQRLHRFGAALAAAHAAGVVVTDCHPGNALCTADGGVALLDLEMAEPRGAGDRDADDRRAFDVAYAASYLTARERAAFLAGVAAAASPTTTASPAALARAAARVAPYAPLFAHERRRQRAEHVR